MKNLSTNITPQSGSGQAGKRYTVKELALQFGCGERTITKHIKKVLPDLIKQGKTTFLDEAQVTVLLASVKAGNAAKSNNIKTQNAGVLSLETEKSPLLELEIIRREQNRLAAQEKNIYKRLWEAAENRLKATERALGKEVTAHAETKEELKKEEHRHIGSRNGLKHYQDIAEAGGLAKSDKEDREDTYPKWAEYWNNKKKR